MTDLTKLTLAEAREGLRGKQFSSTELAQAFLAAIEAGNKSLNAYVLPTPERALAQAKASDYRLTEIVDPAGLRQSLQAALGGLVTIEKKREIWLWNNVRIHLDRVKSLGDFLEFESVLNEDMLDEQGHAQLAELSRRFGVQPGDLIAESYSDLLLRRQFSRLRQNSKR